MEIHSIASLEDLKVTRLISSDGWSWNMFLINELLLPVDVDCISRILLSMSGQSNRLICMVVKIRPNQSIGSI